MSLSVLILSSFLAATPDKGMRMVPAVKFHSFPGMVTDIDDRTRDVSVVVEKMGCKPATERLDLLDAVILAGESVDGVFHRVGRQAEAVIAFRVNCVEIAFECDIQCEALDLVSVGEACDLHQANTRLTVIVLYDPDRHWLLAPAIG